ncbi:MAG: dihydropteroate synthase [Planctomycetota bacterium]
MTASLPFNPRVLASPEDPLAAPEATQLPVDAAPPGAWCIALDGVGERAGRELRQAVAQLDGSTSGWTTTPRSQIRLCLAAQDVPTALRSLDLRGPEAASVYNAVRGVIDAWRRSRWTLRCGGRELPVGASTLLMGIVNVTPDSFSDGGQFHDASKAIDRGRRLADEGADLLDIGGESTRPGAQAVDPETECRRVLPVIEALAHRIDVPISVDTSKALVARRAIDAGATLINDVTALRGDPAMAAIAAETGLPLILMHMRGTPRTMQADPHYDDLMGEIIAYLRESMAMAVQAGVAEDQLIVDPGIGFGKTVEHNLEIQRRLPQLRSLGRPILLGTSRKSFIGRLTGADVADRLFGTAATAAFGILRGAHLLRVHDVAPLRQVAQVTDALLAR